MARYDLLTLGASAVLFIAPPAAAQTLGKDIPHINYTCDSTSGGKVDEVPWKPLKLEKRTLPAEDNPSRETSLMVYLAQWPCAGDHVTLRDRDKKEPIVFGQPFNSGRNDTVGFNSGNMHLDPKTPIITTPVVYMKIGDLNIAMTTPADESSPSRRVSSGLMDGYNFGNVTELKSPKL